MSSSLSQVPVGARRTAAATLGLFATLFVAIGAVAAVGTGTSASTVFSVIAFVVAVVLGLMAWGVAYSIRLDRDEQRLDAELEATVARAGGQMCGCGHEHDPGELHITDADPVCEHDGSGAVCAHDCDTCVLAALRPTPAGRAAQDRPRPASR